MTNSLLQEIVCCMGQPVAGNPTQFMMERAFAAAGLDWRYLTLEVSPESLGDAVRGMRAMGFVGGNFTIPHKTEVVALVDELTEAAELIGAVNCVYFRDAQLIGDNTDGRGFVQSLRDVTDPSGKNAVVLGAGGAARAIVVELARAGVQHLTIVNRSEPNGRQLTELVRQRLSVEVEFVLLDGVFRVDEATDVIVNATSVGLGDLEAMAPIDVDSLTRQMLVADVIVNPPHTQLLQAAEARGCRTLDGLGMLVNQASDNFRIWTGMNADTGVMREALEEYLEL